MFETCGRTRRSASRQRFVIRPSTIKHLHVTTRCAVECGVGGPLAGLASFQLLQASTHSAAGRAGTIQDGNLLTRVSNSLHSPSGMVDPLGRQTLPPSPAEPKGQRDFALHPATSARTRCIHRASVNQSVQMRCIHPARALLTSTKGQSVSIHAGGHM
jgi:hypothetical protein